MPYPISKLFGHQDVVTAPLGTSVRDALGRMATHNFSQLPVVDGEGIYQGILSEHSIVEHLHKGHHKPDVLNDTIDRWYEKAATVSPDTELFEVFNLLRNNNNEEHAVIVTNARNEPVGVVTHFDLAQFFGNYAHAFILIEYIERTLRLYIEAVYPDEATRNGIAREMAKKAAEKAAKNETDQATINAAKVPSEYADFTLRNLLDLILSDQRWMQFKIYFGEKSAFLDALEPVSRTRNDVMHFRNEQLSDSQVRLLEKAANYLRKCLLHHQPPSQADHALPTAQKPDDGK